MLNEDQLQALPPKAQAFYRRANAFRTERKSELVWIEAGSKQFEAWQAYFRRQGWRPYAIRMIEEGKLPRITMVTEFPEWFDPDYVARPQDRQREVA